MNASFNGTAVGMYVEQDKAGAAITKKQGEFVADARLDHDGTDLTGTIDGFETTPTGGSSAPSTTGWIVKLNNFALPRFNYMDLMALALGRTAIRQTDRRWLARSRAGLPKCCDLVGAFGAQQ